MNPCGENGCLHLQEENSRRIDGKTEIKFKKLNIFTHSRYSIVEIFHSYSSSSDLTLTKIDCGSFLLFLIFCHVYTIIIVNAHIKQSFNEVNWTPEFVNVIT